MGRAVPWSTIDAATGIDEAAFLEAQAAPTTAPTEPTTAVMPWPCGVQLLPDPLDQERILADDQRLQVLDRGLHDPRPAPPHSPTTYSPEIRSSLESELPGKLCSVV